MRSILYISFLLLTAASCQKFTWNNPYDTATPKSVFTPDGLAVRQEGENLLLSWSQDNSNISGFKLFRSIDKGVSSEITTLNKSTLSYTDVNVQGGRTYTYTLKAYADKNESNEVSTEIIAKSRPTINTIAATLITENTATSGGAIVSDGGSPITSKGLVWSTSVNPTIDLTTKTNDGSGSSSFERILTNLNANTTYYVRAYATNSVGTAYGNQIAFTTNKPPAPPILESLTQGLVAYYPFNGNANDESGNGNNGTVFGATLIEDRFNIASKAYYFDGLSNYISMPNNPLYTNNEMTISYWKKSGLWRQDTDLMYGDLSEFSWQTGWSNNNFIGMQIKCNGGNGGSSSNAIIDTKWNNLTFVIRGNQLEYYVNGTLISTQNNVIPISCNKLTYKLYIGNDIFSGSEFYRYTIDELRIYNRALTQSEITYLANN